MDGGYADFLFFWFAEVQKCYTFLLMTVLTPIKRRTNCLDGQVVWPCIRVVWKLDGQVILFRSYQIHIKTDKQTILNLKGLAPALAVSGLVSLHFKNIIYYIEHAVILQEGNVNSANSFRGWKRNHLTSLVQETSASKYRSTSGSKIVSSAFFSGCLCCQRWREDKRTPTWTKKPNVVEARHLQTSLHSDHTAFALRPIKYL